MEDLDIGGVEAEDTVFDRRLRPAKHLFLERIAFCHVAARSN